MELKVIICDIYQAFIDECRARLPLEGVIVYAGDIRDLKFKFENAAYVSPANCFGSMGGGIDYLMNHEMFAGIQDIIMDKIAALDTRTELKHSFDNLHRTPSKAHLPIGQAMITPLSDYEGYETCFLITAPTMVCPEDVSDTQNAYLALSAALKVAKQNGIITVICPGLCTGIGNMSPAQAAEQMFRAIKEECFHWSMFLSCSFSALNRAFSC